MSENIVSENELTDTQEKLIYAMLVVPTVSQAAESIGITADTGYRFLKLKHVQDAYKQLRKQSFENALNGLLDVVEESVSTLRDIMRDKGAPASVRVRSAEILLKSAIEVHKAQELEEKLEDLSELAKEWQKHGYR